MNFGFGKGRAGHGRRHGGGNGFGQTRKETTKQQPSFSARSLPSVNQELCTGCGRCISVCPADEKFHSCLER